MGGMGRRGGCSQMTSGRNLKTFPLGITTFRLPFHHLGTFVISRNLRSKAPRGWYRPARCGKTGGRARSGRSCRRVGLPARSLAGDPPCPPWKEARPESQCCLGRAAVWDPALGGRELVLCPCSSSASQQVRDGAGSLRGGAEEPAEHMRCHPSGTHEVPGSVTSSDPWQTGQQGGHRP